MEFFLLLTGIVATRPLVFVVDIQFIGTFWIPQRERGK